MTKTRGFIVGVFAAAALAGCGSSSPSTAGTVGCTTQGAMATATTASYLVVDLGPLGQMYPASQVPSSVPANS